MNRRSFLGLVAGAAVAAALPKLKAARGAFKGGSRLRVSTERGYRFEIGDVISIAGVNNVNPITRKSTGAPKLFVVTTALTAKGDGSDVLQLSPSLIGAGSPYRNVDRLPMEPAALVTVSGGRPPFPANGYPGMRLDVLWGKEPFTPEEAWLQ